MTTLPQVREHINAADFQTIAAFLPPAGDGRTLAVSANEKAVVLRGKRVVDMFSGGAKPVQRNDEAVVASLRRYQLIIGFGDCSHSGYNLSPTRIHAARPAFRIADGEEIRSMIVAVSFALDRDDRSNVEKLMAVGAASADAITVADLAAGLPELPQFIQTLIAIQSFDGPSIKTADPDRIAAIERQILLAADGMLREYGVLSDGATMNVIATSRDAELSLPEKEREANAEHRLKLARLQREDERLERQIQSMEKRLETERIAHQTEKMRTEIMQERLEQSRIQAEIERIDPRMGAASANGKPRMGGGANVPALTREELAEVNGKDGEGRTRLHRTAVMGDTALARALTDAGADVAIEDKNGNTPLHLAAANGRTQTAQALIDAGANLDAGDDRDNTPLHKAAAWGGSIETTQALIDAGANLDAQNDDGKTPLHNAASPYSDRRTEMARTLIDAGANLEIRDNDGDTPLHEAMEGQGGMGVAQALITAGANLDAKYNDGDTLLHKAVYRGETEAAQMLIAAGANLDARNDHGTPLHSAASANGDRTEMARTLIAAGANIDAGDNDGDTPLHEAAGGQSGMGVAQVLIDAGANLDAQNHNGKTPLHNAASANSDRTEMAQMLIDAGANLDAGDNDGDTPLHEAAGGQDGMKVAQILIAAGANVNAHGKDGGTPLHQAVSNKSASTLEITRALIAAGADIHAKDKDGKKPLHQAVGKEGAGLETAKALIAAGANPLAADNKGDTPLSAISVVRSKGRRHRALNLAPSDGWDDPMWQVLSSTADKYMQLHLVATMDIFAETVQELIDAGLNVDDKDTGTGSNTPLHTAAHMGKTETLQALIAAGANLNAVNENGDTPLHIAARMGKTKTAQALITAGANLDAKDKDGKTPLDRAKAGRKRKTVWALIDAGADIHNNGASHLNMTAKTSWLGRLFSR